MFTGADARGRPTQMSRTVHGGKRDAQRLAAQLEASGRAGEAGRPLGRRRARRVGEAEPRHVGAVVGARPAEPGAVDQEGPDRPAAAGPADGGRCRAVAHAPAGGRHGRPGHQEPARRAARRAVAGGAVGLGVVERRVAGAPALDEGAAAQRDVGRRGARRDDGSGIDRRGRRARAAHRRGRRRAPGGARVAAVDRRARRPAADRLGDRDHQARRPAHPSCARRRRRRRTSAR